MTHPVTLEKRPMGFDPEQTEPVPGPPNLWLYRRIATRQHVTGRGRSYTGKLASKRLLVRQSPRNFGVRSRT